MFEPAGELKASETIVPASFAASSALEVLPLLAATVAAADPELGRDGAVALILPAKEGSAFSLTDAGARATLDPVAGITSVPDPPTFSAE